MKKRVLLMSGALVALCILAILPIARKQLTGTKKPSGALGESSDQLDSDGSPDLNVRLPLGEGPPSMRPPILNLRNIHGDSAELASASGRIGLLDSTLESEGVDPTETRELSESVGALLSKTRDMAVNSVTCGKSLCRLEIRLAADDLGGKQAVEALSPVRGAERAFGVSSRPGPRQLVAYISRGDAHLPASRPVLE
jgi:hypothetical protein